MLVTVSCFCFIQFKGVVNSMIFRTICTYTPQSHLEVCVNTQLIILRVCVCVYVLELWNEISKIFIGLSPYFKM